MDTKKLAIKKHNLEGESLKLVEEMVDDERNTTWNDIYRLNDMVVYPGYSVDKLTKEMMDEGIYEDIEEVIDLINNNEYFWISDNGIIGWSIA
jgi:cyanate lyase